MAQAPVQQVKKRKTWLWVLLGVVAVLVVLIGLFVWWIFGGSTGSAKKAATNWITQLSSEQVDQAYQNTSTGFQQGTDRAAFESFLEAYPIMTNMTEVKFTSIERQSGEGQSLTTVDGTLTGSDGATSPIEVMLILENDDWKVHNVDLRGLSN
ncbi:MAG: DUF4864 domain-containing protein [Parcubacteria group bacterium]